MKLKPKVDVERTQKGTVIRIDTYGALPMEFVVTNEKGLKQLFARDHVIGDTGFDERWRIGGDLLIAKAMLTPQARKTIDKAGKDCTLRIEAAKLEATTTKTELMDTGAVVKALEAVIALLAKIADDEDLLKGKRGAPAPAKKKTSGEAGSLSIADDVRGAVSKAAASKAKKR